MKFVVEHVSKEGGLGDLCSQPDSIHTTPLSLISTMGGSAPHLKMCCSGGMVSREAPFCIPAQHFIEHMKVLQSFKKGVAHTFCCTLSFWRSSGTLLSLMCEQNARQRGARMEDASIFTTSLVHAFFFVEK